MTPYAPYARSHRSDAPLLGPLIFLTLGLLVLVFTLPLGGLHIPGMGRVSVFFESLDLPWKPERPTHVLLPDVPVDTAAAPAPAVPAGDTPSLPSANQARLAAATSAPAAAPAAPAAAPAPAPVPAPAVHPALAVPLPATVRLENFRHQWQTWNNCGPATITMATSHFGRPETQVQAAPFLKPNSNDKNVNPDELVAYARSVGLQSDWLINGDFEKLKRLVANDIPVMVEMWFTPHPNDGMGHYRLLVGYDDASQQLIFYDSYDQPGVNVRLKYAAFDADWRVFSRTYLPVYPKEKEDLVAAILGPDRDFQQMRLRALQTAQEEAAAKPNDAYAWFNVGTALTLLDRNGEAVQAFDRARTLKLPWRMLWYQFAPFQAYLAEGRTSDVLALTGANLQLAPDLEESQYFRGRALELQGQSQQARAAYQAAVRANPKYTPALHALSTAAASG
jgi:tetratricopeptide (TPR) repeat protein